MTEFVNALEYKELQKAQIITFCLPEKRNPLSVSTLNELANLVNELVEKPLIFTGTGGVFASGANLREISRLKAENACEFAERGQNLFSKIRKLSIPTFAAIDGYCMGGGLDLALSCNRRIATPRSIFAHPGAKLGIITGWGGTQLLPKLVGQGFACEMLFTGKNVASTEALRKGLIESITDEPVNFILSTL
ncbi:MAG: enoyl-CoA hydratase/isomerase family protein [Pyrinomonadaceae bacterium]